MMTIKTYSPLRISVGTENLKKGAGSRTGKSHASRIALATSLADIPKARATRCRNTTAAHIAKAKFILEGLFKPERSRIYVPLGQAYERDMIADIVSIERLELVLLRSAA